MSRRHGSPLVLQLLVQLLICSCLKKYRQCVSCWQPVRWPVSVKMVSVLICVSLICVQWLTERLQLIKGLVGTVRTLQEQCHL